MLISIIVPIYNSEKHLHQCLNSVLSQTYKNYEVLLINDGSTDNSGEICDVYAVKDSRFKVFHKENGGVSTARNIGIKNARGKWISFLDSDDILEKDALKSYVDFIEPINADIVFSNYIVKYENNSENRINLNLDKGCLKNSELIKQILDGKIHGSLCNKIVKTELLKKQKFDAEIVYMEDVLLLISLLLESPKVFFMNEFTYNYCQRADSVTNNISSKSLDSIKKVINILSEKLYSQEFSDNIFKLKARYKFLLLKNLKPSKEIKTVFSEINELVLGSTLIPYNQKILLWFEFKNIKIVTRTYLSYKKIRMKFLQKIHSLFLDRTKENIVD